MRPDDLAAITAATADAACSSVLDLVAEIERLRAYAMALRGDLVEIDTALTEGEYDHVVDVLTRHLQGTLDEDVAALSSESQE